jgi:hypothetical protein
LLRLTVPPNKSQLLKPACMYRTSRKHRHNFLTTLVNCCCYAVTHHTHTLTVRTLKWLLVSTTCLAFCLLNASTQCHVPVRSSHSLLWKSHTMIWFLGEALHTILNILYAFIYHTNIFTATWGTKIHISNLGHACNASMPFVCTIMVLNATYKKVKKKKTPWSESASELHRPSDRRLSAKLVPTFTDRGWHVVSVTDPCGRILGCLDRPKRLKVP